MNQVKQELIKVLEKIDHIVDYDNKNLTNKQYYELDEAREKNGRDFEEYGGLNNEIYTSDF